MSLNKTPISRNDLASEQCKPCTTTDLLSQEEITLMLSVLPEWIVKGSTIVKEYRFRSYAAGLEFAYDIGKMAELEDHHPDILIGWRHVKVSWTTHSVKGLTRNDLVMAAKTEIDYERFKQLLKGRPS